VTALVFSVFAAPMIASALASADHYPFASGNAMLGLALGTIVCAVAVMVVVAIGERK
jgi:hypothetical protein